MQLNWWATSEGGKPAEAGNQAERVTSQCWHNDQAGSTNVVRAKCCCTECARLGCRASAGETRRDESVKFNYADSHIEDCGLLAVTRKCRARARA